MYIIITTFFHHIDKHSLKNVNKSETSNVFMSKHVDNFFYFDIKIKNSIFHYKLFYEKTKFVVPFALLTTNDILPIFFGLTFSELLRISRYTLKTHDFIPRAFKNGTTRRK